LSRISSFQPTAVVGTGVTPGIVRDVDQGGVGERGQRVVLLLGQRAEGVLVAQRVEAVVRPRVQRMAAIPRADGEVVVGIGAAALHERDVGRVVEAARVLDRGAARSSRAEIGEHPARDEGGAAAAVPDVEAPDAPAEIGGVEAVGELIAVGVDDADASRDGMLHSRQRRSGAPAPPRDRPRTRAARPLAASTMKIRLPDAVSRCTRSSPAQSSYPPPNTSTRFSRVLRRRPSMRTRAIVGRGPGLADPGQLSAGPRFHFSRGRLRSVTSSA
jgi:hypothetical protein